MIVQELLIFLLLWFSFAGLWHETMHLLECKRQGHTGRMWVSFDPLPSLHYSCSGGTNPDLRRLVGGLYTSLLCFASTTLFDELFLKWTFLTIGYTQIAYGYFEMKYIMTLSNKKYWIGRYAIYLSIIITMMCIYYIWM